MTAPIFTASGGDVLMLTKGGAVWLQPDQCRDLLDLYSDEIAAGVREACEHTYRPARERKSQLKAAMLEADRWARAGRVGA